MTTRVKKELEYHDRVRTSMREVVAQLEKPKPAEWRAGLEQIEQIFSHDQAIEYLEPPSGKKRDGKAWLVVFQAMFMALMAERRAYLKNLKDLKKKTNPAEAKLEAAAARLRWLVDRALHKLTRTVLKPLLNHVLQAIVDQGQLVIPLAKHYTAILRLVLSYPPHLDHTPVETWNECMVLSFAAVLGDRIPKDLQWAEDDETSASPSDNPDSDHVEALAKPGPSTRKRALGQASFSSISSRLASGPTSKSSYRTLSEAQIELMKVISILLRASNAPILSQTELSPTEAPEQEGFLVPQLILLKITRFFREYPVETSAHAEAIWGLNAILTQLELNARVLLLPFAAEIMPELLTHWGRDNLRNKSMKEGLLVAIRILTPFLILGEVLSTTDLDAVWKRISDGLPIRPLPFESLRLAQSSDSTKGPRPFQGKTFRYGFNFEPLHAFTWSGLEAHADCVYQLMRSSESRGHPTDVMSPRKRQKLAPQDPIVNLLKRASSSAPSDGRIYPIQVVLFFIDRYWSEVSSEQQSPVTQELVHMVHHEDGHVQAWSFLCIAAIICSSPPHSPTTSTSDKNTAVVHDWASVWTLASRRISNPITCRAACHMMHVLLSRNMLPTSYVLTSIERMTGELIVQGPPAPYDSVCAFFSQALRVASQDVRAHQLRLGDQVISWFAESWTVADGSAGSLTHIEPFATCDILRLLEAACGLAVESEAGCQIFLPDSPVVEWMIEHKRTDPIRQYFFDSIVPSFSLPTGAGCRTRPQVRLENPTLPSNTEPTQQQTQSGEHGMPSPTEKKCTALLSKAIEQLWTFWDQATDAGSSNAYLRIRSTFDVAVLTLLFEISLHLNGTRYNMKLIRRGYELIVHVLSSLSGRTWTSQRKALVLQALEPLIGVEDDRKELPLCEVMVDPGNSTGLRRETLVLLQRKRNPLPHGLIAEKPLVVQRLLWQELSKYVSLADFADAARQLITSDFLSEGTDPAAADSAGLDDDDNFGHSEPQIRAKRSITTLRLRSTDATISFCVRLLVVPCRLALHPGEKPPADKAIIDWLLEESQEERFIQWGHALFASIRRKEFSLPLSDFNRVLNWFSILQKHTYSHSERLQLFAIHFVESTMDVWRLLASDSEDPLESDARDSTNMLGAWLCSTASAKRLASWRVRDRLASFLDAYVARDPEQTMLQNAPDEDEMNQDQDISPVSVLMANMTEDVDARVRFRVAVTNARVLDVLSTAGIVLPKKSYGAVFQKYTKQLTRSEHMLTRFLSLCNFMIIDSSLSRAPYWNLLEPVFHVETFLSPLQALLEAAAVRMGLYDRSALFKAFASNIAAAAFKYNMEFTLLPPALLGFRTRKDLVVQSFPLICPTYCLRIGHSGDQEEVFRQRFASEYMDKTGKNQKQALSDVLSDVLALRIAFYIDDLSPSPDVKVVLEPSQEAALESAVYTLTTLSTDSDPRELIRRSWDRIVTSIVKLFNETDCSPQGSICEALRTAEDDAAANTFSHLTKFRQAGDFEMHAPNPPAVSAVVVARALKWLQIFVTRDSTGNSSPSLTAMTYHVLHQLFAAISNSLLLNEQLRLVNALCFHVARNQVKFKNVVLLRTLTRGAASMLAHLDLARAAQSILDWCLERYGESSGSDLTGFTNVLSSIGQTASRFTRSSNEGTSTLGKDLLDWVEARIATLISRSFRPYIINVLMVWPRPIRGPLSDMLMDLDAHENVLGVLNGPEITVGKFRIARRLRSVQPDASTSDEFWALKACIPDAQDIQDDDVEAFVDLLYRSKGQIETVQDEPSTTPSLGMRPMLPDNHSGMVYSADPKQYLVFVLHDMLSSDAAATVNLAYRTLRAVLDAGYAPGGVEVVKAVYNEIKLLNGFPGTVSRLVARTLGELTTQVYVSISANFEDWVTSVTVILSESLAAKDTFFGQITEALQTNRIFAEEALPILTRCVLEKAEDNGLSRKALSLYFAQILQYEQAAVESRRSIIHVILHLRSFNPPNRSDPLAYNDWLDLDYLLLANAARACGAYATALLFLELASEHIQNVPRDDYDAMAEDIQYAIYSHIEEPDGFYGIKSKNVRDFLLHRFRHESQWDKSFQFHGAAFEACSDRTGSSADVVRALHSFGFDKQALQMLSSSELSQSSAAESSELAYTLGWRTESWELPPAPTTHRVGVALYTALQAVHRERGMEKVQVTLSDLLREQMTRLKLLGNEDMVGIKESVRVLMCLGDLRKRVDSMLRNPESYAQEIQREHPSLDFEFQDLENIMATRISFLRSRRLQEAASQIGDLTSDAGISFMEAEQSCLIHLGEAARNNNRAQLALNSLQRAQELITSDISSFNLECEFASVLWMQGEHKIAVDHLRSLMSKSVQHGEIARRWPFLLSQLGEWTSQAALEKPVDIKQKYFDKAVRSIGPAFGDTTAAETAEIFHRFGAFAEQQYLALFLSPDAATLRGNIQDMSAEVQLLELEMQKLSGAHPEWRAFSSQLKKSRDQLAEYEDKYNEHHNTLQTFLQRAIDMFSRCLSTLQKGDDSNTVIRLCSLWFDNFKDDRLNLAIRKSLTFVPSHKFLFMSHQLSSRLSDNEQHEGQITLEKIMRDLVSKHTFHTFYQLYSLSQGAPAPSPAGRGRPSRGGAIPPPDPLLDTHRVDAAKQMLRQLRANPASAGRAQALEGVCDAYLEWAKYYIDGKKIVSNVDMDMPSNVKIRRIRNVPVPVATDQLAPDPTGKYSSFVSVLRFDTKFSTAGGVNVPKVTKCQGSDGGWRKQLYKGQGDDDMRQDAVMEQVFELVNTLLTKDQQTRKRELRVNTYKVLPLAPQAGIIEFVPFTMPLKLWLDHGHTTYRPTDLSDQKAAREMIEARAQKKDIVQAYIKVCSRLKPVMRHFFTNASRLPMSWFGMRLNYARSVATTSIVGHMIGLGDRHTSNILLQNETGEVVHIDLGIAFDQGRKLPIPELVPFRLTRDMVDGLGSSGTEGVFRRCAEETLRVLREDSDVIMTVLSVFKTDPLYSWTIHPLKLRRKQQETDTVKEGTARTTDTHGTVDTTNNTHIGGAQGQPMTETDAVEKQAERALTSVAKKLNNSLSVSHDVNELIAQATDVGNLGKIYHGWRAWL
ncbi:Serine/threonine-protein kinase tel1 [Tulasnella sp. JGI-2019a]|nr:Serine/threonine-protein kinase tel1 [Tulasnella sp. JGI-2019a]